MSVFRPMLAAPTTELELASLKYPMLGSAKVDGIRMLVMPDINGKPIALSRKLEPIPNKHVQALFARPEFIGLDGELAVGPVTAKKLWQVTQSGVLSIDGTPNVKWHVFDNFAMNAEYVLRAKAAMETVQQYQKSTLLDTIQWLPQARIDTYEQLRQFEEYNLELGFEGVILRAPMAPYKHGRSTVKQAYMIKVKRFEDGEAEIVDTVEQRTNNNEATTDALGYTKRSSHAGGKADAGVLGALQVIGRGGRWDRVSFEIGTGFTAEQRANLWAGRQYIVGKLVKYKHFPIGAVDRPRHPVFLGFRDQRDT